MDFHAELNKEQLNVVDHGDGFCLVLAGAGSGKTRTIVYRVAHLLEHGVSPDEILLVTFTNKAAREMMMRVGSLMKGEAKLNWSGTFHHIAYRILRRYAPLLGYDRNFTILDSDDSKQLLSLCIKGEGIDRTAKRFPSPAVIGGMISYARNAEQSIQTILEEKHPHWIDFESDITRIAEAYKAKKQEANAMDFDDLLVQLYLLLLKFPAVKEKYASLFTYILVDEYQDTNTIQASILELFASKHQNLLVVGDDAQSIYSFRAADIRNILSFESRHADAKVFRLETNYRSTPEILALANDVIAKNRDQYRKSLKSVIDSFIKPEIHAFTDAEAEANFIATRILELRDEGMPLNKMAVLFRASHHSQALELELVKRDIPYVYRGGVRFFERAHIKDVLGYVRVFQNSDDVIAWSRVLNMQVGIGPSTIQAITRAIAEVSRENIFDANKTAVSEEDLHDREEEYTGESPSGLSLLELERIGSQLSARAQKGWNDFLQAWIAMEKTDKTPAALIQAVVHSKYAEYAEMEYEDFRDRLQDIEQLALFAVKYTDAAKFLAEVTLQEGFTAAQARGAADEDESMVLSTIHQAKGLEWDVVFMIHVSAGQFPNDRALTENKGIEEERRLFYVAITRARRELYVSYPLLTRSASILGGPSMFLEELDRELIDEHNLEGMSPYDARNLNDADAGIIYVSEEEPFDSGAFGKKKPPRSFLMDV